MHSYRESGMTITTFDTHHIHDASYTYTSHSFIWDGEEKARTHARTTHRRHQQNGGEYRLQGREY